MKCSKCGFENPNDLSYCGKCGTQLGPVEDTSAPPTKTIEAPKEELTTGSTFAGRYQIIEELGKGGMGKVYRVLDKKLNEEVALKLIKPDVSSDKKIIERFKTELKLARKIGHPSVGRMYELLEHEGTHYITMEYVAGQDLKGLIRQTGQLAVGTTVSIAKQVCEGLIEAHRLGVVHRDLKPSNIMIDKAGSARIMDFGIARSLKAKGITGAGVIIGTPEYMSPEQIEGKDTDQRSDIYSLGVILYEMLTGRLPFVGDTPLSIAVQHRSDPPKDPRALNAQIPETLNLTILKCLEKNKGDRYQTAEELHSALDKIEHGIPTAERATPKSTPITSKEITIKFTLKRLILPAAIFLALAAVAFFVFRKPGPTLNPRRILVAPFENQTGDDSMDQIGPIATSWINQGISQTDVVEVVPSVAVMQFERLHDSDVLALAREKGAGTVVSGVYHTVDNTLSFRAEITDVKTGKLIESFPAVSGSLEEKMGVIENLRERVKGSLSSQFDILYGEISLKSPPLYEAYSEYMLGLRLFHQAQAIEHFERALELDKEFTLPYVGLAVKYAALGEWERVAPILEFFDQNQEQFSPYERHWLDCLGALMEGNWEAALNHIRRAENLAPEYIYVNYMVGWTANQANRPRITVEAFKNIKTESYGEYFSRIWGLWWFTTFAEAYHMMEDYKQELKVVYRARKYYPDGLLADEARALAALGKIDKVNQVIEKSLAMTSETNQGSILLNTAKELREHGYDEAYRDLANRAVEWFKVRLASQEITETLRSDYARALYWAERWDEAQDEYEQLTAEFPDNFNYLGYLGILAARKGDREKAQQISENLKNIDRPYIMGAHTYWRACIASLLGEKEQAVSLLREALTQGQSYGISLLREMDFESLRDYKPFQDLLKPKG
jgi:serine/threonine protein kinase/tetratricopeptide (TPR) repeat protein